MYHKKTKLILVLRLAQLPTQRACVFVCIVFVFVCTYVYIIMLYVCFYVGEHLVQALPFVLPLHFVINLIIIIIIIITK